MVGLEKGFANLLYHTSQLQQRCSMGVRRIGVLLGMKLVDQDSGDVVKREQTRSSSSAPTFKAPRHFR
jgi:hypothetical protein